MNAIIFDCDGVLIDSEPLASATLAAALRRKNIAITAEESHRVFTGNALPVIQQICVETYGLQDVDGLFAQWQSDLFAAFATQLRPMTGMIDLLAGLGGPISVASNSSSARLRASLGVTPLWPLFAGHIYSADMVPQPKPAPDLLLLCAARMQVAAQNCTMIDDSPHGITAARAAGMRSIGFVDPNDPRPNRAAALRAAGADHVATGVPELRSLLRHA
ncbi:HAD-superfamily hydrolase, subfamily IA, variant 3 [Ketogulonicigenium robustum]|uniref:HAD-superfamily hydrolase, subfamily IA, variant 3 n=1 Tax=Ketogulonicigenium robustum TaxID=92947 RepID=A0A1W6P1G3_9RHOB|nr:HAD-IA family hydrolase [Ketogulonicigenium robustum]ARO15263.1 HAD-superfamily hydrolase, subfamily IA, variant 3 [Ketogulonicigenium robustum]